MINKFTESNFKAICDNLAAKDADLKQVIDNYGYPPIWTRPNNFDSLVHIILEQQVSLASALAALNKLRERVQQITPTRVLLLTDEEFKACYCSRQKTAYIKYLAEAIVNGEINLENFEQMPDDEIRTKLTALKGIGNWTVDIYLMFVLHRTDYYPIGDLAQVNALKRLKSLPASTPREELIPIAERWSPYRTVASMILWHFYLSSPRKIQLHLSS
ncbi:DNA-3-methyladenine glycosylase 2 family protein [Mucilaginibacter panaciglaebae]|uniref:DNA-3-methyladenine glycosylase II n=1 Tax=Mucilaginibacter panaciglaebae TaxID=502331 RepID=A0ABP7X2F6_9SPHI